jgi:hypothetical protein
MRHLPHNGLLCFCESTVDEMGDKSLRWGPLAAFVLTTIAVTGYIILLHHWLLRFGPINAIGLFMDVGVPIFLSFASYVSLAHDNSTSKVVVRLRAVSAAVLAPAIAWMLYLFVGFVFFDWRL